jgi:hypothetical protein
MKNKVRLSSLPFEILLNIFKYMDVYSLSNLISTNNFFYNIINSNKWRLIDNLIDKNFIQIPNNIKTYNNYKYIINWTNIILHRKDTHKIIIPEHVISWIPDLHDLELISIYQKFSESLIRKLFYKLSWKNLLSHQILPVDIIEIIIFDSNRIIDNQDWFNICSKQPITYEFIETYEHKIQWHPVSSNKHCVSFELIDKYSDKLIWQEITKHGINENILIKYTEKFDFICWSNISQFTKLSLNFIKCFLEHLDLNIIFRYQSINDEYYIDELIDRFNLDSDIYFQSISLNQPLGDFFLTKYKNQLSLKLLIRNKKILRSHLAKIYDPLNLDEYILY